jgi:hypothetical protein
MQTLSKHEEEYYKGLDNRSKAKRIVEKLYHVESELEFKAGYSKTHDMQELAIWERDIVTNARLLITVLEQEQWRQREAIKLFLAGRVDRAFIRNVSETWNGDIV